MSSDLDIQIVNPLNLVKIENFLNNSTYRETIETISNFNTRLCIERRLRLPFLDPQTKIAQNHSNLFMNKRQRMPGFHQGQLYSYPAARWRKTRRQYLSKMYRYTERPFQSFKRDNGVVDTTTMDSDFNGTILEESSSLGGADTSDSKDSQQQAIQQHTLKEELPKEWFYDELELNDMDGLEEPKSPADDEYDYDPRYGNKKRKKRRQGKRASGLTLPMEINNTGRKGRPSGSGIGSNNGGIGLNNSGDTTPRNNSGRGRGRRRSNRGGGGSSGAVGVGGPGIGGDSSRLKDRSSARGSPGLNGPEPPSFETAAASAPPDGDLRNYEKYL